ncbi:hypothetical protein FRB90_009951, partial [Tulasnella sp. 427]
RNSSRSSSLRTRRYLRLGGKRWWRWTATGPMRRTTTATMRCATATLERTKSSGSWRPSGLPSFRLFLLRV